MTASNVQRGRRAVQMVFGVTLGIGVGEAGAALIGTGAVAIGVVVFVARIAVNVLRRNRCVRGRRTVVTGRAVEIRL